jgi:hypothetical protein
MDFIRGVITQMEPDTVYEGAIFNQVITVQTQEHELHLFDSRYTFTQVEVGRSYQFIVIPITGRHFEYSEATYPSIEGEMWTGQIVAPPYRIDPSHYTFAAPNLEEKLQLPVLTTYGTILLSLQGVLKRLNATDVEVGRCITWKSLSLHLHGVIEEPSS